LGLGGAGGIGGGGGAEFGAVDVGGGAGMLLFAAETGKGGGGNREEGAEVGGAKGPACKLGAELTEGEGTATDAAEETIGAVVLGLRVTPDQAEGAPILAVTTGDLELKLSKPPGEIVEDALTAGEPAGTHEGGAPNGDDGAGHVAGVVELPLLRLLTLLLWRKQYYHTQIKQGITEQPKQV
jgi:hypothetical protein